MAEKHYNTMNDFLRNTFGSKVFKVSLNAGFSCPNKDGTKGYGGCIFCSPSGSGDFAGDIGETLASQFKAIKTRMHEKWPEAKYIAYFQANTNTYAPADTLRTLYDKALNLDENVVGLSIGTRADCVDESVIDVLESLHKRTYLQVEIGLQSMHEKTAKRINRGHDLATFDDAVKRLRKRGINVVVHIINGFPWEDKDAMLETVDHLGNLDIQGIKIHMLHITKNTALGNEYLANPFPLLTLEEYVDITIEQIRRLHPDVIVQRVTGDAAKDDLIAPQWTLKKFGVMNEIDKRMRKERLVQGDLYSSR